jgi:hypothetical protein
MGLKGNRYSWKSKVQQPCALNAGPGKNRSQAELSVSQYSFVKKKSRLEPPQFRSGPGATPEALR